ncbi:CRISPR-associated endonuclease Cas4g/Cas1g [Lacunimicrobium album]
MPLIPVRMLNEFTYCPRLGYLEWVQGEWAENLETMQGTFGHRNVDKADRKEIVSPAESGPAAESEADSTDLIHARSIQLSSLKEGITAKLDLLELEGREATPVDYKRGKIPDIPEGVYEPERVQLCAQGLILRDAGYTVNEGMIYYIGSRKRVVVPFDDALIARTRQLIADFKATTTSGHCPPPLVDSPKCPRCSLVGICLPDEVNLLSRISSTDGVEIDSADETSSSAGRVNRDGLRRLLPSKNLALPLYVQKQGAYVGKSGDRINIKYKDEKLNDVRLIDISQLCLYGNVSISAQAMKELLTRQISICHFTYGGWFYGISSGLVHKNVELRIKQYNAATSPILALNVARQLIAGKIKNSRTILRRHLGQSDAPVLKKLADYYKRVFRVDNLDSLRGIEGMAAKEYFAHFFPLIAGASEMAVEHRNRRPPTDPINAVLSFVYSLLTKELTIAAQSVGFDPMLGFLHTPRYGRPSLALDLAEEFRPLIADSVTMMLFNNGEVSESSFIKRAGAVAMTDAARKSVLANFERRMESEITHPIFGYKLSYRRVLEVQTRLLARHLMGELPSYPNFCTR